MSGTPKAVYLITIQQTLKSSEVHYTVPENTNKNSNNTYTKLCVEFSFFKVWPWWTSRVKTLWDNLDKL